MIFKSDNLEFSNFPVKQLKFRDQIRTALIRLERENKNRSTAGANNQD